MKQLKTMHRWLHKLRIKRNRRRTFVAAGLIIAAIIGIHLMTQPKIDPAAYKPLLDTIAKGESKGNYNAYFGNGGNTSVRFTDMTIAQVLEWQQDYVAQGKASNAVGRYQFLGTTLQGLVQRLGISTQLRFSESMQDRLAIALMERRGAIAYADNRLSPEEFAANLAKEWASLPRINGPNPEQSYYQNDGLNKAHVTIPEVMRAVERLKEKS
jgi:conjugal transfer mating pair stabilization protein TraG